MKILLATANYLPFAEFGAERAVRMLAGALITAGHDVRVVTTSPAGAERTLTIDNHHVEYLAQQNLYWSGDRESKSFVKKLVWHVRDTRNRGMGDAIARVYDDWRPDVVHTHILAGFSVNIWAVAAARGIPVVHTLHDYYLLCPKSSMFNGDRVCPSPCLTCRCFSWARVRETRHVAAVTAPSKAVLAEHTRRNVFAAPTTTRVVQYVCPQPSRAMWQSGEEPRHIGFIGRLTPDKGLPQLLRWFESTTELAGDIRLIIAGTGPLEKLVTQVAARNPRIEYVGYVQPSAIYPRIAALVVPSIWNDPSPVVIREAYGYGVPVVGSSLGGIPELVKLVDARLVFDPSSPASLGQAITRALDPALRPHFRARALIAMSEFTAERVVDDMTSIYREVTRTSMDEAR